ncbi:MAG: DEAD/DEAH box helicase family protein [Candidatus ainarchaeum sp.]|nr:DEAD/DEAH box helicase family protein [Candidatus ainarchaeum sp.]
MEFKFDSNLDYQRKAINSTVNLFKGQIKLSDNDLTFGEFGSIVNKLNLTNQDILNNLNQIQIENKLDVSKKLDSNLNFTIEMETGTGKTYVYLRTIFELNKKYGLKKFIIVVPSVAIREGVLKSLEITKNHFSKLYDNIPYNYYDYSSKDIVKVRQFSRNNNIEIMIITLDSFNKESNILNQNIDKLRGEKGIDLISSTKPILILDEPQNMESDLSKTSLEKLNPLFTLRYSATHKNIYNLIYKLNPIDAYNLGLVKKIDVLSVVKENDFNTIYIKCLDIIAEKTGLKAKLELNTKQKSGYKKKLFIVKNGDNLYQKTKFEDYNGYIITEINKSLDKISFSNGVSIKLNESLGDNKKELMKYQIRETIKEHFSKQIKLKPLGIKVLSLFFIDRVSNYVDKDGFIKKTFEEEYNNVIKQEDYKDFKGLNVIDVQGSYFSTYKTDSSINKDQDLIDLILKDKEKLISFDTKTQFIFSHSALKEGWDNPNVFNICTLNETQSTIKKRQEIGRGLRLPVNQDGTRIKDFNESLTIIANEHYDKFADSLQKEYEDDYGVGNSPKPKNRRELRKIKIRKGILNSDLFNNFWNAIAKKTKYEVNIDTNNLIKKCVTRINSELSISETKINVQKRSVILKDTGVDYTISKDASENYFEKYIIPNLVEQLSKDTNLTKKTIIQILLQSPLEYIFKNPRDFITQISNIINKELTNMIVSDLNYISLNEIWDVNNFNQIIESYNSDVISTERSLYDNVIFDSNIEENLVVNLEKDNSVKLYIKLPNWFVIDTPVGKYNPDWAIIYEVNNSKKLYLVNETKGSLDELDLKGYEKIKIECAKEHFNTININYEKIKDYNSFINFVKKVS